VKAVILFQPPFVNYLVLSEWYLIIQNDFEYRERTSINPKCIKCQVELFSVLHVTTQNYNSLSRDMTSFFCFLQVPSKIWYSDQ